MKRSILFLLVCAVILASCGGGSSSQMSRQAAVDDSLIQVYIKANHINATKHSSGLYYQIIKEGTGANAASNSSVDVTYEGKLTTGLVFDHSVTPISFALKDVVEGWQIGIPLVKAGGKIMLIIPSHLGYGPGGSGPIPENAVLVFDIDVLKVQ
ncbi:FKBP-type peptidyl-prolyl cis-trans isomerase [Mucilaginibacter sp. HMF5004]|uniref:FKBP-type peptidyl-prolyl cis-trans isomerase n=1 Tax=Mucilaginibacter rivuli TaxID=2857527 RepID=UPI001C5F0534|nr:FKBP-type peptidyl-prolyl cis-trans isomerase [Mucilaginibacter rivuli]MBW4890235.1 FKBP-type peptidyl-prolyl cis-trans isomerase [Mucilaginibacter rivuli]